MPSCPPGWVGSEEPLQRETAEYDPTRSEIQEISPIRGMQSGQKLYYRIQITTLDDGTNIAATKLENLSLARALIDRLE